MKIATVVLLVCQVGMTLADAQCSDSLGNCPKPRGSLMQLKTLKQNQKTQTTFGSQLAFCPLGEFRYFETPDLSIHFRTLRMTPNDDVACFVVGIAIRAVTHHKGKKYISIVTDVQERIQIYDGNDLIKFPVNPTRKKKKRVGRTLFMMTPNVTSLSYDLRVDLGIAILRISENGDGTLSLGVVQWPAKFGGQIGGLIQTYDDTNCSMHKEVVMSKGSSLFKDLQGSRGFNHFDEWMTYCPARDWRLDCISSAACASFAFPGLKVLGSKAVETARTPKR